LNDHDSSNAARFQNQKRSPATAQLAVSPLCCSKASPEDMDAEETAISKSTPGFQLG
jgi:hypothetical protein